MPIGRDSQLALGRYFKVAGPIPDCVEQGQRYGYPSQACPSQLGVRARMISPLLRYRSSGRVANSGQEVKPEYALILLLGARFALGGGMLVDEEAR